MKTLRGRIIRQWARAEMAVAMVLTVVIVGTISAQIIARYVFNAPFAWMEEAVMIMFIYLTLFAAAVATKEKRHIIVDLFPKGPVSRFLGAAMSVLTIVILGLILANIGPIMTVEMRRTTISLPVNFPLAYYNSIPLAYCFVSISIAVAYDLIFERKDEEEAMV